MSSIVNLVPYQYKSIHPVEYDYKAVYFYSKANASFPDLRSSVSFIVQTLWRVSRFDEDDQT